MAKLGLTTRNFNLLSRTTFWTRSHVRSRDKLKTFYLHYHNNYGYQTWQGGYIGASVYKVTSLLSRSLVRDFDFFNAICRFRTQTPKSATTSGWSFKMFHWLKVSLYYHLYIKLSSGEPHNACTAHKTCWWYKTRSFGIEKWIQSSEKFM